MRALNRPRASGFSKVVSARSWRSIAIDATPRNLTSRQAGWSLDTAEGIRRGGHSGAGIVLGDPAGSLVLMALQYRGLEMPPDEKLPSEQIAAVREWIVMGAPDSRGAANSSETTVSDSAESDPVSGSHLLWFAGIQSADFGLPFQAWPNRLAAALLEPRMSTETSPSRVSQVETGSP